MHSIRSSSLRLDEVMTVLVHDFWSSPNVFSLFSSSLVTQCLRVVVFGPWEALAFIRSSNLARCSGVILASASGGIGGSPFAPGAAGNLCSEDALGMLEAMGLVTGVDVNRLIEVARGLERTLGAPLPGKVHAARQSEAGGVRA